MTKRVSRKIIERIAAEALEGSGARASTREKVLATAKTIKSISPNAWRVSETCGCLIGIAFDLPVDSSGPSTSVQDYIGMQFDELLEAHVGEDYSSLDKVVVA